MRPGSWEGGEWASQNTRGVVLSPTDVCVLSSSPPQRLLESMMRCFAHTGTAFGPRKLPHHSAFNFSSSCPAAAPLTQNLVFPIDPETLCTEEDTGAQSGRELQSGFTMSRVPQLENSLCSHTEPIQPISLKLCHVPLGLGALMGEEA